MTWISLIFTNAFRNPRRSASNLASVTVFFVVLGLLWSVWSRFYSTSGSGEQGVRLLTRNRVSLFFPILTYYREHIRKIPGVVAIAQLNFFGGTYKDGTAANFFPQYGTDPMEIFTIYPEWKAPAAEIAAFQKDPSGAAVPRLLADRYGWKLNDRILLKGTITPVDLQLTVRTIFDSPNGWDALLFPWQPLADSVPYLKGLEGIFVTRVDSPASVNAVMATIDQEFHNAPQPTRTETESAYALESIARLGSIQRFMTWIAAATAFTLLLITATTIALNTSERLGELAIMRVLGYSKPAVIALTLSEAGLITLLGAMLSVPCVELILSAAATLPSGHILGTTHLGYTGALMAALCSVFITLVSAIPSMFHMNRMRIAEAIRFRG